MFENPRKGRQARNFTINVPKILDLKSSTEQILSENCRWVPLVVVVSCVSGEIFFYARFLLLKVYKFNHTKLVLMHFQSFQRA